MNSSASSNRPTISTVPPKGGADGELTRKQAANILGMTPRSVDNLLRSGYLPDLDLGRILGLARRPTLVAYGYQPMLRQGRVQSDVDEREFVGDGADLDDDQVIEADRQWWRCDVDAVVAAGLLPVTIAGVPVTVMTIHGHEETRKVVVEHDDETPKRVHTEVRHSFKATLAGRVRAIGEPERDFISDDLTPAEQKVVRMFLSSRSTASSGGPIAYLPQVD